MAQLFPLKAGPSPTPVSPGIVPETESTSLNRVCVCEKNKLSFGFSVGYFPPAPAGPPRGPGSVCANTIPEPSAIAAAQAKFRMREFGIDIIYFQTFPCE